MNKTERYIVRIAFGSAKAGDTFTKESLLDFAKKVFGDKVNLSVLNELGFIEQAENIDTLEVFSLKEALEEFLEQRDSSIQDSLFSIQDIEFAIQHNPHNNDSPFSDKLAEGLRTVLQTIVYARSN